MAFYVYIRHSDDNQFCDISYRQGAYRNQRSFKKETIFLILDTAEIPVKNLCGAYWASDR